MIPTPNQTAPHTPPTRRISDVMRAYKINSSELGALYTPRLHAHLEHGGDMNALARKYKYQDANSILQASDALWANLAASVIDRIKMMLAPIDVVTRDVSDQLRNFSPAGVLPKISIPRLNSVGTTVVDCTNWNQSNLNMDYVSVEMHRYSTMAGLTTYDYQAGNNMDQVIGGLAYANAEAIVNAFLATIASALPTPTGATIAPTLTNAGIIYAAGASTITPEFASQTIGPVFGALGPVDQLVLDPAAYGYLQPYNLLGIPLDGAAFGILRIDRGGLVTNADGQGKSLGYALRRDAISTAYAEIDVSHFNRMDIEIRYLMTIAGVPVYVKFWADKATETYYASCEGIAGFAVNDPRGIAVISSATSAAPGGD